MEFFANLHTHSTHSDGKYTPEEMVKIAKAEGYKALAITDHDTVTAFPFLKAACDREGLETIFGVEFTAISPLIKGYFHMVAFGFDPEYPEMKDYLEKLSYNETAQTKYCFEKGKNEGYLEKPSWEGELQNISWEEVLEFNKDISWLCNEHVFRAMKAKGIVTDFDYMPFFKAYFGPRRYEFDLPYEFLPVEELIGLVHRAGGIILIAHPENQLQFMDILLDMGLDGVEVYHPDVPKAEQEEALRIALEKDLFIAGGSDHSGLCGGMYAGFEHPEETEFYIEPHSCGTYELHFRELLNKKVDKEGRARLYQSGK